MAGKRHRWGEKRVYPLKSERDCLDGCGVTMVTHHEHVAGWPRDWIDFWRGGECIAAAGVPRPVCEPFVASCVQIPSTISETP